MKTKLLILTTAFLFVSIIGKAQQDPFQLYKDKDLSWKASIYKIYIKQYAGLEVNQAMLEKGGSWEIQEELKQFPHKATQDIDSVLNAVASGKKVFFFIENAVWGGIESGTTFSGSWQRKMPMCSGFYIWKANKCFQKEGINYHCGKKEKAHKTTYFIMQ